MELCSLPVIYPGQIMVEVIKIMATSFRRSHAHTATLSAPDPAAGHHQPTPLPETPGHSEASLGQSLVGSLLLCPGSWCTQGFVCVLQESVSPGLCKSWQLYSGAWWASIYGVTQSRTRLKRLSSSSSIVGLMTTSSKRSYGTCRTASPRAPAPESGHC